MSVDETIAQLMTATNTDALQRTFKALCAHFGEVRHIEVTLCGTYGEFAAFCTVQMQTTEAEDQLVRRLGFKQIGRKVYLPIALPALFERRAVLRAA